MTLPLPTTEHAAVTVEQDVRCRWCGRVVFTVQIEGRVLEAKFPCTWRDCKRWNCGAAR